MGWDWKVVSDNLIRKLGLNNRPVGVKMIRDKGSLSGKLAGNTTVCHMLLRSRCGDDTSSLYASDTDMRCVWGASALGLMRSPERLKEGYLYLGFVSSPEAGKNMHAQIGMLGDEGKQYESLMTFPLHLAPQDPDALVMYMTPGRALRVIIAALNLEGGCLNTPMTGQASVCASLARAIKNNQISVDIPCLGDRRIGLVRDDELVVVIPVSRLENFLAGLERSEFMAPYPYFPFTSWEPVLPAMFVPLPKDVE